MVKPRRNFAPARRTRGRAFSLIELVLCLVIASIMAAIALPKYGRSAALYRADVASRRVAADLALARATARSSGVTTTAYFASAGYMLDKVPDRDRRTASSTVDLREDPYRATCATTGLPTVAAGVTAVSYDRYGTPSASGTIRVTCGGFTKIVTLEASTGRVTIQ